MPKVFYAKLAAFCLLLSSTFWINTLSVEAQTVRVTTRAVTGNLPRTVIPGILNDPIDPNAPTEAFCAGTMINVPFEVESINDGRLLSDNVFQVEISDPSGNFLPEGDPNRRLFGLLPGRTSGTLYARLPSNLPFGTNYRIRVVANRPRMGTTLEHIPAVTDSTRPIRVAIFPKPCFSAESKAVNCFANLAVRINTSCSFGRCNCPGTDTRLPVIDQTYYRVDLVGYPVQPNQVSFDPNTFTYTFSNLPEGWYQIRVTDRFGCDSTLNFFHVTAPARPITTINITNITHNSATVSWYVNNPTTLPAGATYDVRYRPVDESYPDTTPETPYAPTPSRPGSPVNSTWTLIPGVTGSFINLGGLQNNTRYEVQVRMICRDASNQRSESAWSASKFFDTRQIPTPVDQNCRVPGGIFVRYQNSSNPADWGRIFFNLDPNGQASCYEVEYGPVFDDETSPTPNRLNWGAPGYVSRHFNNQRFVFPEQVVRGIPIQWLPSYRPGQLMQVRVRANCSLRCATTQLTLSQWSSDLTGGQGVLFRLPPSLPRLSGVVDSEGNLLIKVYPNPSKGQFNIDFNAQSEGIVKITVRDLMGKIVAEQLENAKVGENNYSIDLTQQSAGIYLMQVSSENEVNTVKIVVE
ncbi:MAG: T9SS type A sorting domain-containing protein [Bacteroidia bacterium]|nr:T9SS type A sorting domain-containing protein [Bacteroidia bacterium]